MAYVSELLGKPVVDVDGQSVGRLEDIVASVRGVMPHPAVVAIEVKRHGETLLVPFADTAVLVAPAIALTKRLEDVIPYKPAEHDLFLANDILDKQIIDTDGVRVVRVNDLELTRVDGDFYVANVDVSGLGLLRRMGLAGITHRLGARYRQRIRSGVISWDDVELLSGDQPMRLKVSGEKIADLHPADLAEIISDLTRAESGKLLQSLDVKTLADTLEEVEPDFQASLIEAMPDEKVADVLEEMGPDEAADLLAELPSDRSRDLLELMEDDEARDVRMLLAYPEDTAGGIMTTEFFSVPPELTAGEAIVLLRRTAHEAETITYVYVTDSSDHLLGVFSLAELVIADPGTPIAKFMHHRVVSVNPLDSQEEVAQAVSKYNLVAIPVVDEKGRIQGIVTADDALDKVLPTAWKKRLPRLYH